MKFLKGCFGIFLFLILFILTLLLSISVTIRQTFLKPTVIHEIIDSREVRVLLPDIFKEYVDSNEDLGKEGDLTPEEQEKQREVFANLPNEVKAILTEEDEKAIKDFMHASVDEGFDFLYNSKKENITINVVNVKPILVKVLIQTSLADQFKFPFEFCSESRSNDCIQKDTFAEVFEKILSGQETSADILKIIPACAPGQQPNAPEGELPNCIPADRIADIDKYGIKALTQENLTDEDLRETKVQVLEDEYIIDTSKAQENEALNTLRQTLQNSTLIFIAVGVLIAIIYAIFILTFNQNGFIWIAAVNIFTSIILITLLIFVQLFDKPFELFEERVESKLLLEQAIDIYEAFAGKLSSMLLIFIVVWIVIAVGGLMIRKVISKKELRSNT